VASFHWLYLCICLVSWDGRVRVAGKWCDLSERGLGIGRSGVWVYGVGIFMDGGALAAHRRFCLAHSIHVYIIDIV
jgi:hypothetical protein